MEVQEASTVGGGSPGAVQAAGEGSLPSRQGAAGAGIDIDASGLINGNGRHLVGGDKRYKVVGDLGDGDVHILKGVVDDADGVGEHFGAAGLLRQDGEITVASQNNIASARSPPSLSDQEDIQVGIDDAVHRGPRASNRETEVGQVFIANESPGALADGSKLVCSVQTEGARSAAPSTGDGPIVQNGRIPATPERRDPTSVRAEHQLDALSGTDDAPVKENGVGAGQGLDPLDKDPKSDDVVDVPGGAAAPPGTVGHCSDESREGSSEKEARVDDAGSDLPGFAKESNIVIDAPVQGLKDQVGVPQLDIGSSEEEFRVKNGLDKEADSSMDSTANSAAKPHAHEARVSHEEANSSSSEDSASSRPQTKHLVHDQPKKRIDLRHQFVREIVRIQHDREQFEKQVQADKQNASTVASQDARIVKDSGRKQGRGLATRPPATDEPVFVVGSPDRQSEAAGLGANVERRVHFPGKKGRASAHSNREKEVEESNYHHTGKDSLKDEIQERSHRGKARSNKPHRAMPIYRPPNAREVALLEDEGEDVADSESVGYDHKDQVVYFDLTGFANADYSPSKKREKGSAHANIQPSNRKVHCVDPQALEEKAEGLGIKITLDTTRHQRFVEYLDPAAATEATKFIVTIPGDGPSHGFDPRSRGKGPKNDAVAAGSSLDRATTSAHPPGPLSKGTKQGGIGATLERATIFLQPSGAVTGGTKQENVGPAPATLDRATVFVQPPVSPSKGMRQPSGPFTGGTKQENMGQGLATLDRATVFVQPPVSLSKGIRQPSGPGTGGIKQENTGQGLATLDRATVFVQPPVSPSKGMRQDGIGSASTTLDRATSFVHPSGPSSFQFSARPDDTGSDKVKASTSSERVRAKRGKNRARDRPFPQGVSGKSGHPQVAKVAQRTLDPVYIVSDTAPRVDIEKQRLDAFAFPDERSGGSAQATSIVDFTKPLSEYQPSANHEQLTLYPRISGRWGDIAEDVQEATASPTQARLGDRPLQAHRRWGDDSDTEEGQESVSPRTSKRGRVKSAAFSLPQVDAGKLSVEPGRTGASISRQDRVRDRDRNISDPRKRESGIYHHRQSKPPALDAQAPHKAELSPKKNVWERLGPQKESARIRLPDDQANSNAGGAAKFSSQDWRKYQNSPRDLSAAFLHDESKEGLSSGHGSNAESDISHISEDSADVMLQTCKDSKQKRSKFELYVPRRGFSGS